MFRGEGFQDVNAKRQYFDDKDRLFVSYSMENTPFVNAISGKKPVIACQKLENSDVSEIIIGPRCEFIEAKTQIRKILFENGYDVNSIKIERANIPIHNI